MRVSLVRERSKSLVPAMAEMAASPKRKRSMAFRFIEDFVCPKVAGCRQAARLWASKSGEVLGSFRQPCLQPSMQWRTTATCFKCEGCHSFEGKAFEFLACDSEDGLFTKLTVSCSGSCSGPARKTTRSRSQQDSKKRPQATVEERSSVHEAADFLIQQGLKATPSAIHIRVAAMKKPRVPDNVVRSILRWRRRKLGFTTLKCLESEGSFRSMVADKQNPDEGMLCFTHIELEGFAWVCLLVPFFAVLQSAHEQGHLQPWCLTADFTFRVEILGY